MVVNQSNEILMLIEIEEESSLGPKKIHGVLMAILFADTFTFSGHSFTATANTVLLNAGTSISAGSNATKIRDRIAPRIKALAIDHLTIHNLEFVLEEDLGQVIAKTMDLFKSHLLRKDVS